MANLNDAHLQAKGTRISSFKYMFIIFFLNQMLKYTFIGKIVLVEIGRTPKSPDIKKSLDSLSKVH